MINVPELYGVILCKISAHFVDQRRLVPCCWQGLVVCQSCSRPYGSESELIILNGKSTLNMLFLSTRPKYHKKQPAPQAVRRQKKYAINLSSTPRKFVAAPQQAITTHNLIRILGAYANTFLIEVYFGNCLYWVNIHLTKSRIT